MPDWTWVILVYLTVFLLISLVGASSAWGGEPPEPHWVTEGHPMVIARSITTPPNNWFTNHFINNWYRWDTGWYLKISAIGYNPNDHSVSFQPLYPFVIKMVKSIFGISYLGSAILVSRLACIAALILFFEFTKDQFESKAIAQKATVLLLAFPSGFFLFAGYTEALYLTLILSSWYLYWQKKWFWAGLLGGLSSLTRIQGVVLTAPLLWMCLSDVYKISWDDLNAGLGSFIKEQQKQTRAFFSSISSFAPLFAALMPALSAIIYSFYLEIIGMSAIAEAYSNRGERALWPWEGLWRLMQRIFTTNLDINDYINLTLFIIFVIIVTIGFRRLPHQYSIYNLAMLTLVLMMGFEKNILPGFMRYMLTIFPIFMVLGKIINKTWLFYVVVALSMSLNLMMTWAFVNWFWVA